MTVVALASLSCTSQSTGHQNQVTNLTTPGNLQSNYKIGCIKVAAVKNVFSPADLYKGVADCIDKGDVKNGVSLYALAGVYGRFDTMRVADKTAHQALLALQMGAIDPLPEEKKQLLTKEVQLVFHDKVKINEICTAIRALGPPAYKPNYMIQHGMGAFMGSSDKNALVADFDPKVSWDNALSGYLHCP